VSLSLPTKKTSANAHSFTAERVDFVDAASCASSAPFPQRFGSRVGIVDLLLSASVPSVLQFFEELNAGPSSFERLMLYGRRFSKYLKDNHLFHPFNSMSGRVCVFSLLSAKATTVRRHFVRLQFEAISFRVSMYRNVSWTLHGSSSDSVFALPLRTASLGI